MNLAVRLNKEGLFAVILYNGGSGKLPFVIMVHKFSLVATGF